VRGQLRVVGEVVRDPRLLRIELAFFGFNAAEFGTWVAILVYAFNRGGASLAGTVAAIQLVPSGLVAPFGAFAGDRFRRDRVLFFAYLVQAVALASVAVALTADAPFALTLAVAAVASASLTFTRPTQSALLPSVARNAEELTAANAVSTFSENAGVVVGPFVAGVVLARWGPGQVFALFAAVMAVAALLVARLRVSAEDVEPAEPMGARDVVRESFGGFRFLFHDRHAGLLVLVLSGGIVAWGALDVLFVAVAITLLGKGEGWAGFLSSASGLGGLIGSVLAVGLVGRRRLVPALGGGSVAFGGSVIRRRSCGCTSQ